MFKFAASTSTSLTTMIHNHGINFTFNSRAKLLAFIIETVESEVRISYKGEVWVLAIR